MKYRLFRDRTDLGFGAAIVQSVLGGLYLFVGARGLAAAVALTLALVGPFFLVRHGRLLEWPFFVFCVAIMLLCGCLFPFFFFFLLIELGSWLGRAAWLSAIVLFGAGLWALKAWAQERGQRYWPAYAAGGFLAVILLLSLVRDDLRRQGQLGTCPGLGSLECYGFAPEQPWRLGWRVAHGDPEAGGRAPLPR